MSIISSGQYFKEDGSELATPQRFNAIFDEINANMAKEVDPNPVCDAFTDAVIYIKGASTATTYPGSVTIGDVTPWPKRMLNDVTISFSLESGSPGQLGTPTGSGPGAQVSWDAGTYNSELGTDGTKSVTIKMTASWDSTTKYAYTTFNLVKPAAKGDPGINKIQPILYVSDTDVPLDAPLSGDALFYLTDASLVPMNDSPKRAWKLFHISDLATDLLGTAPNYYVGTLDGSAGDPNFSGTDGSTPLGVPIKVPGQYEAKLSVKGNLDQASGDLLTTTTPVSTKTRLNVHPFAAFTVTYNDGDRPTMPTRLSISQGFAAANELHTSYTGAESFYQYDNQYHYVEVVWGFKPDEPDSDGARLFKLSASDISELGIVAEGKNDYFLVNLNAGGNGSDWWNHNYFWLEGQNTSGYEILDTLTYSEVPSGVKTTHGGNIRSNLDNLVIKVPAGVLSITTSDVLSTTIWQIGPGAEKYKVELNVLSPDKGTVIGSWKQASLLSLDGSRPAPIKYRFLNVPKGLQVSASVTSINGSVASSPQNTSAITAGYDASWVPAAPTNLSITPHTFGVQLSFDSISGADFYEIAYGTNSNPAFDSNNLVIRTRSTRVDIHAETGSTIYAKVRGVSKSGLAGTSTTVSGSASAVPIGQQRKHKVVGSRQVVSGDMSRDNRTVSYHTTPAPITIKAMGVYVHDVTFQGGNTVDYLTIYNGNDTIYYSVPISGVGYYTDDNFPDMSLGQNERIRISSWHPSWDSSPPSVFNDIEVSVDYTYDELANNE